MGQSHILAAFDFPCLDAYRIFGLATLLRAPVKKKSARRGGRFVIGLQLQRLCALAPYLGRWLQLRFGRGCRSSFLRLVVRQRFRKGDLGYNHAIAFFRVGVRHRHVWPECPPLYCAAFRVNEDGLLGVVILHRSRARLRAERDVVGARRVSRDRARTAKRTRARGALAHARCARGRCGCS